MEFTACQVFCDCVFERGSDGAVSVDDERILYGKQKGSNTDLKAVAEATAYLQSRSLATLDQLDTSLQDLSGKAQTIRAKMKEAETRMKVITGIQKAVAMKNTLTIRLWQAEIV